MMLNENNKIGRPRQIYTGKLRRDVPNL